MANLPIEDYCRLLALLTRLQTKRALPPNLSTRVFEVVLCKLEKHWMDDLAVQSILLLKRMRRSVEATLEFGENMRDFFGRFLTQSSKITSADYYSLCREVICMMSFYIMANQQVQALFRSPLMIDILKNWLRVAKALNYQELPQAYRLCMLAIHSPKPVCIDLCDVGTS